MTASTRATSSCRASLPGNQGINWIVIKSNTAVVALSLPELEKSGVGCGRRRPKINSAFLATDGRPTARRVPPSTALISTGTDHSPGLNGSGQARQAVYGVRSFHGFGALGAAIARSVILWLKTPRLVNICQNNKDGCLLSISPTSTVF